MNCPDDESSDDGFPPQSDPRGRSQGTPLWIRDDRTPLGGGGCCRGGSEGGGEGGYYSLGGAAYEIQDGVGWVGFLQDGSVWRRGNGMKGH